jgi:hypothetical protein
MYPQATARADLRGEGWGAIGPWDSRPHPESTTWQQAIVVPLCDLETWHAPRVCHRDLLRSELDATLIRSSGLSIPVRRRRHPRWWEVGDAAVVFAFQMPRLLHWTEANEESREPIVETIEQGAAYSLNNAERLKSNPPPLPLARSQNWKGAAILVLNQGIDRLVHSHDLHRRR